MYSVRHQVITGAFFIMAASNRTQNQIINDVFYLVEKDDTLWATDSSEYGTAKGFLNMGIGEWELYDNTRWNCLFTTLTAASTGTKTTTAGDYDYACPDDMRFPGTYVRTVNSAGNSTYWEVIDPVGQAAYANSTTDKICWFTGSTNTGFTLNFNPNATLTTGETIKYEYYKKATLSSATTDQPELSDPYFLVYFIAAHMSDEGLDNTYYNIAQSKLEGMRVNNMAALAGQPNSIETAWDGFTGFGL